MHVRQAGKARGGNCRTVVRAMPADNRFLFRFAFQVPVIPDHLDRGIVGFRARPGEEYLIQSVWRTFGDFLRQLRDVRRRRLEEGVIVGEL